MVAEAQCLEQDLTPGSWISDWDMDRLTGCVGEGIFELGLGGDPDLAGDPLQLLWLLLLPGVPGPALPFMASEKLPRWPQTLLQSRKCFRS
jgi:hypothetical protein